MIDLENENLIPILDVRKFFPVSVPTLRRWTASGKLETARAGSKVLTSKEAVARMLRHGPQQPHAAPLPPTRKQAKRQHDLEQVSRELDEIMGSND